MTITMIVMATEDMLEGEGMAEEGIVKSDHATYAEHMDISYEIATYYLRKFPSQEPSMTKCAVFCTVPT
jgi:hypothetical protein